MNTPNERAIQMAEKIVETSRATGDPAKIREMKQRVAQTLQDLYDAGYRDGASK